MKAWGSSASVIAALGDDAAAEVERLERDAAAALERLRASPAPGGGGPDPAPRLAAARRAAADLEADEDWQDIVAAAADRDAWIASIVDQGRRAIAGAPDVLAWTAALAEDAARALPGSDCIVSVPAAVLPQIDDAWRGGVERRSGKRVTLEAAPFAAGCMARTPDGRITFDNRLDAREARTLPQWRAALARTYESAVEDMALREPA
jgi:vacuolar-type H+-ATPase subunit E/Vma4